MIECKDIEPKVIKGYTGFMILSNYDTPLRIEMSDRCVICFDISSCYKGNFTYFNHLSEILDHPDTSSMVMAYLLSLDLSNWPDLQNIGNQPVDISRYEKLLKYSW